MLTHTLNLTINNSSTGITTVTACDSYIWDGNTYSVSGIYTNVYTNSVGCDSTHTLNLTINNSNTGSSSVTVCDSYLWDGVIYTTSGAYSNTYTNLLGCDSIHTLNLIINQSDTSYTNITACDSVVWNGNTYTQSGTYYSGNGSASNIAGFTYMGSFNGSFYYYSQTINLWSQADSICNSLGGHLVTISDASENNFINNL